MGYFKIALPGNRNAAVSFGTVVRASLNPFHIFRKAKHRHHVRTGYIIIVNSPVEDPKVYHLLKSNEGQWLPEGDNGFQVSADDEISMVLKKAIDEYKGNLFSGANGKA
jgi:hypothetical protein